MSIAQKILKLAAQSLPVEYVSEGVAKRRMKVCLNCEKFNPDTVKCRQCGCFLEIKTGCKTNFNPKKLRTEITHCPLGRWNDKKIANQYRALDGLELLD